MVAARVVQGAGGGLFPLCMGIVAGIGAGGGLLMGGLLIDHASWQWVFWAGALTAGFAALGSLRLPDGGARTPGRVDVPGAGLLLLPASLTMLVAGGASGRLTRRFGPKAPLAAGSRDSPSITGRGPPSSRSRC
ncbi:hypothetical protein [Actinomadura parmotrematis]|uniref:MFS transporter n=1 Tax=Actinomadura parmotrematis TaxID=2864039 RepID=A0ABS7FPH9_9ACTN|nr:hypothetical protein [Actinomadura parmotrematis]MBW8482309.1 hypothetical protein [Actinomadura parmotrematis]